MRSALLIVLLAILQTSLFSHDPLSSFFQLDIQESHCLLSINLSQYGTEQAITKKYPELDLASIDPGKFKEILISYIKDNTTIEINGESLEIGMGAIKLGSHQTDLKFELKNIPYPPKEINVEISCFQENSNHSNFFKVLYKNMHRRVKLVPDNNYKSSFIIGDTNITSNTAEVSEPSHSNLFWLFPIALILGGGIQFKRLRNRNSPVAQEL